MKTILGILIVVCLVFVGCGNEPDDTKIRTVGDLKKWVIEEIYHSVRKVDNDLCVLRYKWEASTVSGTWESAEPSNAEKIDLILDYLQLEVVRVPAVREKFELKSTFIEE